MGLAPSDRKKLKIEVFVHSVISALFSVRQERKTSTADFAAALGVKEETAKEWWTGEPPDWRLSQLAEVLDALGLRGEFIIYDPQTDTTHTPHGLSTTTIFVHPEGVFSTRMMKKRLEEKTDVIRQIGNIAYNMAQKPVGWNAEEQFARIRDLADGATK